jgi:hypothetical protein
MLDAALISAEKDGFASLGNLKFPPDVLARAKKYISATPSMGAYSHSQVPEIQPICKTIDQKLLVSQFLLSSLFTSRESRSFERRSQVSLPSATAQFDRTSTQRTFS